MQIWMMTVPPAWEAEEEALLLHWVPPQRRQRLARFRRPEMMRLRLAAYALEGLAAYRAAGIAPQRQRYAVGEHGKPFLCGAEHYRYNLSHSGSRILLGTAGREIGVDIEKIRAFSPRLMARCFSPEERDWADTDERATALWTRKEAVCKWDGRGLTVGLREVDVLAGEHASLLYTARDGAYMLSVCCEEMEENLVWERLERKSLCALLENKQR